MAISESVIGLMFGDLTIMFNISKQMVDEFNLRIKNWTHDTCIADIFDLMLNNLQTYMNYVNNYDMIINTVDKFYTSNSRFHDFIAAIDNTPLTQMLKYF